MLRLTRTLKLALSRAYDVVVWGTLGGLVVHAVMSAGFLERTRENRDATSTATETSELLDLNSPNQP